MKRLLPSDSLKHITDRYGHYALPAFEGRSRGCGKAEDLMSNNSLRSPLSSLGDVTVSRRVRPIMWYGSGVQRVLVPLLTYNDFVFSFLWNIALAASLIWISFRIYEIYKKPVSELVDILGIDIPPIPDVALAGITNDSVLLYWKPPENYHSPLRHFIQVNGINVGEFNRTDASVEVTGLQPGNYYTVRAIAKNAANFSSLGRLIRIRTIPLTGHEGSKILASSHRGSQKQGKGVASGRRNSPSSIVAPVGPIPQNGSGGDDDGSEESMANLTKKLDLLRRQKEEQDRQIADEEAETERTKAALVKERDELKQIVEEKEKAHIEFRKQVNELERQSKAAQRKKSAKERLLQQKKAEKQKMKDDILRWKSEKVEIRKDTEAMKREKVRLEEEHEEKMTAVRKTIEEGQAECKTLEEEIRDWGIKIKELEEERRKTDTVQNEEEQEAERREREEDLAHEMRMQEYQNQYTTMWTLTQQAKAECEQAEDRLAYWMTMRAKEPRHFAPIPHLDFAANATTNLHRRTRQSTSRGSTISIGHPAGTSAYNSTSSVSPIFSSAGPFFNMSNGMTALQNTEPDGLFSRDIDGLSGGAPLSPTANALLPSGLLRDDDPPATIQFHPFGDFKPESPSFVQARQAYRPSSMDMHTKDPQSPGSFNSRSPSLMSSPQESVHNLNNYYPSRDHLPDSDKQSMNSTNSMYIPGIAAENNASVPRGISGLFNFNRQRGKSSLSEGPSLGTLKQGQSQSFPRNLDQSPLDPLTGGRRRLSSAIWPNQMTNFLTRNSIGVPDANGQPSSRIPSIRRNRLQLFGSKLEPSEPLDFDRTSSPRPSSTYSFENALPRPSTDGHFGWGSSDISQQRSSPLGADWSILGGPWSRSQSRRPSVQHGSTSNLSIGSTPLEPDDYSSPFSSKVSPPAPIGTERFKLHQRSTTPKLNPAAPSFTTRLFSRTETKKSSKTDKSTDKSKPKDPTPTTDSDTIPEDPSASTSSPPVSRLSRDAHSITTAISLADSHSSLDHSTSGGTPTSSSETAAVATSSLPKESLMQRITRKSSSSKFNLPFSKDRGGGGLFSKKAGESMAQGGDVEEDVMGGVGETGVGEKEKEREKGGRPSLSWSRVMSRKSRVGKGEGDRASETEMTGEEEEG